MQKYLLWTGCLILTFSLAGAQGIIINHNHTDIARIPESAILQARSALHIAYGHTSHGSQLVDGMNGLVNYMNGLGYTHDLYAFDWGGAGGTLDFYNTPFSGAEDLGNPDFTSWETATRNYLNAHPAINVVIWSWCGQVSWSSEENINTYLSLMNGLEQDYPDVHFVYMTGHLDGSGEQGNLNRRNQQIRDYCTDHDKTLYDFADIESYDPDGAVNYMLLYADDNCDYDSDGDTYEDTNWAENWQNTHTQNVDWYSCGSAHSKPLNANQKAYAAWWLWARIAGWAGPVQDNTPPSVPQNLNVTGISETEANLTWEASSDAESGVSRYNLYRDGEYIGYAADLTFSDTELTPGETYTYEVTAVNGTGMESGRSGSVEVSTPSDEIPPTQPQNLTASAVSSSRIDLTWTAATDNSGVTGYRIYRDGSEIGTVSDTQFSDTGLLAATAYTYRVAAYDAAGLESVLSDEAAATTLDPSQETFSCYLENGSEVEDSFIFEADPNTHFGEEPYVSTIDRFVVRFNLPDALTNKQILSAGLGLYVWNQTNYQAGETLDIYRMTKHWEESAVTWNMATASEAWTTPGGDYESAQPVAQIPHQQGADHVFYPEADMTSLVQQWTDGTLDNHGLLIMNSGTTGIGLKANEYDEGARPYLDITYTDKAVSDIRHMNRPPESIRLYPGYPNPFNPSTTITYQVTQPGRVRLTIYNMQGQQVRTLVNRMCRPGIYHVRWNGMDDRDCTVSSGQYLVRFVHNNHVQTGKLQMMR